MQRGVVGHPRISRSSTCPAVCEHAPGGWAPESSTGFSSAGSKRVNWDGPCVCV